MNPFPYKNSSCSPYPGSFVPFASQPQRTGEPIPVLNFVFLSQPTGGPIPVLNILSQSLPYVLCSFCLAVATHG